ncbi:hypothetical protein WJX72_002375 [[Myrmecia] bisecta]|uniref:Uncharacterized protein n=1 Tax=[Myrmecia] bisecta TaxID=41462 RepID=A0AAW1P6L9_9CHLO
MLCLAHLEAPIHKANDEVLEHTSSVLSGATGVDMEKPWKLLFLHTQSPASTGSHVAGDDTAPPPNGLQDVLRDAKFCKQYWDDWGCAGLWMPLEAQTAA